MTTADAAAGPSGPPPARPAKRGRVAPPPPPPANVIVDLVDDAGESMGPPLDVPSSVTPTQLAALVNNLKSAAGADALPYAFLVGGAPLTGELGAHLASARASVEGAIQIVARPQATFRVRPVARCAASMPGHTDAVLTAAFSPDGTALATGGGDNTVRLWDLTMHTPAATLTGHTGWVMTVAWSPTGDLLASGGADAAVRLWRVARGGRSADPVGALRGHTKIVTCAAWEPAHASPGGRLATGAKDGTVRLWNAASKKCVATLASHRLAVTAVAWGGDARLYSASRDGTINVWDDREATLITRLAGHGHWVNALALSTGAALRSGPFDERGATGMKAGASADAVRRRAAERYAAATATRPEILASASDDFTVALWRPGNSSSPIARLTGHAAPVADLAFSPDGTALATASFDKSVRLWDGATGAFRSRLLGHVGAVYRLAWSADSRLLVSASKDSTLKVWDAASGKLVMELPGHADEVYAVDWAPAGGSVASGGKDRVVRIWKA